MAVDETTPLLTEATRSLNGNGNGVIHGENDRSEREDAVSGVDNNNINNTGQNHDRQEEHKHSTSIVSCLLRLISVENRILFAGFLITLSFSFTQVP